MAFIKYTNEKHRRSLTKSIVWRIMGILFLALITYIVTGNWIITTLITVIHHSVAIFGYYTHERFWLWIRCFRASRWKPILRVILYEIVFGYIALGIVSYLLTGEIKQATLITLIYVTNKLWMYVAYDKIWEKLKWGKVE